ncbi:MAG: peptidyl-prolyl cis-trans isomerase, partial [Pseudomonadales bacterium]
READRRSVTDLLIDEELLLQRAESLGVLKADPGIRKTIAQAAISEIVEEFLAQPLDQSLLERFFQRHRAVFEHPTRVAASALRFESWDAAERASVAAANGGVWAELAAMPEAEPVSHLPGSLLPVHVMRRYLGPGLTNVALSLKPGEISPPVESAGSAYLVRVSALVVPSVPEFSEITPDVRAEYLSRGREAALADKLAELWQAADIQLNPGVAEGLIVGQDDYPDRAHLAQGGARSNGYLWWAEQ